MKNFKANSVFHGKRKLFKILNDKKYIFNTVNSGHSLFFRASKSCSNALNVKSIWNTLQCKISWQTLFSGQAQVPQKSWKIKNISLQWKISGQTLFFRASASCSKFWMIKNIYSIQWIQGTLCFSGQTQVAQKYWKIKNISTQRKVSGQLCFSGQESCSKIWMIKINDGRQGRQGGEFLPYHNHEMCKTNWGSKITNWIQICPFMLKRCNYCMILIIFIVNTSEFAYFFFKSGESQEGRQRLLVLLSPRGFRIDQFVTNCGGDSGERLPCNYLYVSSVTFTSVTV